MAIPGCDAASLLVDTPSMPMATSVWLPDPDTFTWDVATGNTYVNEWKEQGEGTRLFKSTYGSAYNANVVINNRATYDIGIAGTRPPGVLSPSNHCYQNRFFQNTHWTFAFTYTVVSNGTASGNLSAVWAVNWRCAVAFFLHHSKNGQTQTVYTTDGTPRTRTGISTPAHKNTDLVENRNILLTCVFVWHPSINKMIHVGDNGIQVNKGPLARDFYTAFAPIDTDPVFDGLSDTVDTTNATGHIPLSWPSTTSGGNGWTAKWNTSLRTDMDLTCDRQITIGGSGWSAATTWPNMYIHEMRMWDSALSETEAVAAYHDIRATTIARIPAV